MVIEKERFDQIRELLDKMYTSDEQIKDIVVRAGFTPDQLKIVNLLIVQALRYYDAINNGGELIVR